MVYYETSIYDQIDFEVLRTKLYNIYSEIAKERPSQWSVAEDILNACNEKLLNYAYLNRVSLTDCYVKRTPIKRRVKGPRIK